MKSKPPTKKARTDSYPSTPEGLSSKALSPASSSSSSSSIGNFNVPAKASTSITASELFAATKLAAQAAAAASATASASVVCVGGPIYPTFTIPSDLSTSISFPRISHLLSTFKPSTDGSKFVPEGLTMEDVDLLQLELETLWSSASVRIRTLQSQQTVLQNSPACAASVATSLGEHFDPHHQEKINAVATIIDSGHGTRTSVSAAAKLVMACQVPAVAAAAAAAAAASSLTPTSSRKSNNSSGIASPLKLDKQPKKKLREVEGKSKPGKVGPNRTHSVSSDIGVLDSFYKNEAPSQFWEFADAHCRELTQEDLDELDKTIEDHKVIPDTLFNIPPLGKHFRDDEETVLLRNRERKETKPKDVCGPLTQRLVAALVEDRVSTYNNQHNNGIREDSTEAFFINRPGLVRALGLDSGGTSGGTPVLEARLRQVLVEQGLLSSEDADDPLLINPDDEILAEMKRTHNTYHKLHKYNNDKLAELLSLAKKEFERAGLKKELEKADKEVIEAYRTITSCRLKKKPLTKKEKDSAAKALQCRTLALHKLNQT